MVPLGVQKHTCEWPCLVSSEVSNRDFTWTASTTGPSILSNATLSNLSSSVKCYPPLERQIVKKLEFLTILTTYPLSPKFITGRTKFNFKMNFTLRQIWNSFGNSEFESASPFEKSYRFFWNFVKKKDPFFQTDLRTFLYILRRKVEKWVFLNFLYIKSILNLKKF
jgi:hypothetical protein